MIPRDVNARDLAYPVCRSRRVPSASRDFSAPSRPAYGPRCSLPAIDNEGGSIVAPLHTACMLDATARQALWLEHRE